MATTTNYGWTTPDDTALVKDGASAIRTLGTSVDTTTKNLNPQTTLGDIAYRSSTSNVNTRLGIGTAGQVLTVASGVPSWATASAGGMTLLATATPSGASSLSFTSISGSYTNLFIRWDSVFQSATGGWAVTLNADTGSNYAFAGGVFQNQSGSFTYSAADAALGSTNAQRVIGITGTSDVFNENSYGTFTIFNYSDTTMRKFIKWDQLGKINGTSAYCINMNGTYDSTSAITSIEFSRNGSQTISGKFYLYGVK
jgi:hypothetical protein